MNTKYFFTGLVLISAAIISCKKNDSNDLNKDIKLEGSYTALCGNSKNEIIIMGYDRTDQDTSLIILKTDMNGNQMWERRYNSEYTIRPVKILATNNDEYYVAADRIIRKNNLTYGFDNLLIKLNDNGDILFQSLLEKSQDLVTSKMVFSRINGVLVLLVGMFERKPELIEVSATGQVLTKTTFQMAPHEFQIGEYSGGCRYLMYHDNYDQDSLMVNVCQFDISGEIISWYGLIRESIAGNSCFATEEKNIFWLSSVDQGIKLTKTDLANNLILENDFQIPNSEAAFIEGIETIGGSNYIFGYNYYDNVHNSNFFVLKFNGNGDMEKLYLTSLGSLSPYTYALTGLNNGSLAIIHPIHDENGGSYSLSIYN